MLIPLWPIKLTTLSMKIGCSMVLVKPIFQDAFYPVEPVALFIASPFILSDIKPRFPQEKPSKNLFYWNSETRKSSINAIMLCISGVSILSHFA